MVQMDRDAGGIGGNKVALVVVGELVGVDTGNPVAVALQLGDIRILGKGGLGGLLHIAERDLPQGIALGVQPIGPIGGVAQGAEMEGGRGGVALRAVIADHFVFRFRHHGFLGLFWYIGREHGFFGYRLFRLCGSGIRGKGSSFGFWAVGGPCCIRIAGRLGI